MNYPNIYDIKELGFIPPKYGGISVSIGRLIDKLTEDGFIAGGFYSKENKNPEIINSELFEPELNLSTRRFLVELPYCLRILRPYKVLHSHYSLEHMIYMWSFLHILKKKIVVTVHNSMVQSFYSQTDPINRFFLKKVASHKNVTWIAVSEQAKDEMLHLPVHFRDTIQVIPAYIPDSRSITGRLPERLQAYIDKHEKLIVFYGHSFMLHGGKDVYGFNEALSVYSKLVNNTQQSIGFVLCLTEASDVEKINLLHHKAKQMGIDDKVFWQLEPIIDMKALWHETDVYIRPTSTDGDSVAVREALDLGVQVVASDVCPRPNKTIIYKFNNMYDFVDKVEIAINQGHATPEPDYSNYNKLKAIYSHLLNS